MLAGYVMTGVAALERIGARTLLGVLAAVVAACRAHPGSGHFLDRHDLAAGSATPADAPETAMTPEEQRVPLFSEPLLAPAATGRDASGPLLEAPTWLPREPRRCTKPMHAALAASCRSPEAARFALAAALERGTELLSLEGCSGLPIGFVRSLRARLDPQCAETLVAPLLAESGPSTALADGARGLALASRYSRIQAPPPKITEPISLAAITTFMQSRVAPFLQEQRRRIDALDAELLRLDAQGHGRLSALMARADAQRRVRDQLRSARIPEGLKRIYTLRKHYYGTLDELTLPFVEGAANDTAQALVIARVQGVLRDRALLDHLQSAFAEGPLPKLELPARGTAIEGASPTLQTLALHLPFSLTAELFTDEEIADPALLAALSPAGRSREQRRALAETTLSAADPLIPELAELEVSLGLVHHDPARFAEARRLLERIPAPDPRTRFLLALARDLAGIAEQPMPSRPLAPPSALIALADDASVGATVRTLAAYDAAVLARASADWNVIRSTSERLTSLLPELRDTRIGGCALQLLGRCDSFLRRDDCAPCRAWPWLERPVKATANGRN